MGRSVSYASGAQVVTFRSFNFEAYPKTCRRCHTEYSWDDEGRCPECGAFVEAIDDVDDFDQLIHDFRSQLKEMFPSVEEADDWFGREDHILAENNFAFFGMSEYCGLVSYWIVPKEYSGPKGQFYYSSDRFIEPMAKHWVSQIADRFVTAFGELSKVGAMSNGEGVYRRIDK